MTRKIPLIRLEDGATAAPGRAGADPEIPGAQLIAVAQALTQSGKDAGRIAAALIAQGRDYAATPQGARWLSILKDNTQVRTGWALWNASNLDVYLETMAPLGDSPAACLEDIARRLRESAGDVPADG